MFHAKTIPISLAFRRPICQVDRSTLKLLSARGHVRTRIHRSKILAANQEILRGRERGLEAPEVRSFLISEAWQTKRSGNERISGTIFAPHIRRGIKRSSLHAQFRRSSRHRRDSRPSVGACQQPPVPSIDPPSGERLLLRLEAEGVPDLFLRLRQRCPAWRFQGPEAKLTSAKGSPAGSHFAGPTWKLLDGSEVKGSPVASKPAPEPDAVPWLLLKVASETGR